MPVSLGNEELWYRWPETDMDKDGGRHERGVGEGRFMR